MSREVGTSVTPDGYTRRNWDWFPQYVNIQMDEFRKVLDGTVRILSREEVIDRTKICLQNDINDGTFDSYLTPATLFDGLTVRIATVTVQMEFIIIRGWKTNGG